MALGNIICIIRTYLTWKYEGEREGMTEGRREGWEEGREGEEREERKESEGKRG